MFQFSFLYLKPNFDEEIFKYMLFDVAYAYSMYMHMYVQLYIDVCILQFTYTCIHSYIHINYKNFVYVYSQLFRHMHMRVAMIQGCMHVYVCIFHMYYIQYGCTYDKCFQFNNHPLFLCSFICDELDGRFARLLNQSE